MIFQILCAVISRCHQQIFFSAGRLLAHFQFDACHQSLFTHRFHNAAGSKDGNTSLNAQPRVEGPLRCLLPLRNPYRDFDRSDIAVLPTDFPHFLCDHTAGHSVDRRGSNGLVILMKLSIKRYIMKKLILLQQMVRVLFVEW